MRQTLHREAHIISEGSFETRARSVEGRQQSDSLPAGMQLLRDLERHYSAKTKASEKVGAAGLHSPHFTEIMFRHLFNGDMRTGLSVEALRLQGKNGLVRTKQLRKLSVDEHFATLCVYTEERRSRAKRLKRHN